MIEEAVRRKNYSPQSGNGGQVAPDPPLIPDIDNRLQPIKKSSSPRQPGGSSGETSDESEDADDYTPKEVDGGNGGHDVPSSPLIREIENRRKSTSASR